MKLDFRQRLLATTLLVGASMVASPAFAQETAPPPPCLPDDPNCPPETTAPVEGTTQPSISAEGEAVETTGDIIVTGSRIPQPNLTSASPVTVVTAQEVKLAGTSRTEDLINALPQSFAAQGSNIANGSTGTATVNLRGLGSARTMVLVNGRRLHPGDPRAPAPDLNFVPSSLVKRVDVLTGGASSVYGADAVAGVVNFIMDTDFRGLRIDGQASAFMHKNDIYDDVVNANLAREFLLPRGNSVNGGAQDISVAFGAGFDDNRGSILGYATYRNQSPVLQSTRDYSFCALDSNPEGGTTAGSPNRFNCAGSATSNFASIFRRGFANPVHVEGDQFLPGTIPFNFGPYNYFQRPNERYTLGAFAEYEIDDMFKPYLEAMFMHDKSDSVIAPSGNFFNTSTLNCDNALLSAQQVTLLCQPSDFATLTQGNLVGVEPIRGPDPDGPDGPLLGPIIGYTPPTVFVDPVTGNEYNQAIAYIGRRNIEGGGRQDNLQHMSYRIIAGLRGDLDPGLAYNVYGQYGTTELTQVYRNDFSISRIGRAIDVVDDPAAPGTPICRSALIARELGATAPGADANCVPWNIFTEGGVDQASLDYLQIPLFSRGDVSLLVAQADFTILGGEYGLQTPWSDRGISANIGAGYSKHSLNFEVDENFELGEGAGQGGPTLGVSGNYDVRELFGEVEVPIISNSFIEELTVRAGYRYSKYHVGDNRFSTNTYKLEGEFAPVRDVRLRASYNRAVRAPNVVELFSPQFIGLGGTDDPCAGDFTPGGDPPPSATLAQCQLTGVSAAQYGFVTPNPAGQYNSFFGGNPDLAPEKADTYTIGIVLQPRFVPGLAVTVDWFDIDLTNAIGTIGFDTIIAQCLETGDPFFCSKINRNATNATLWAGNQGFITDTTVNVGGIHTRGIDLQGSYARQIGSLGNLSLSFVGTLLQDLDINPFGDIEYDCAGWYGGQCGLQNPVNPKWRHKFRAGITLPNGIGISGQWRYFSQVKSEAFSEDEDLAAVPPAFQTDPVNRKINPQSYFDLALQARITDRYNFRIGANNIFDKAPPVVDGDMVGPPFQNGNTFPQVYDALGRYIFAGFTVDF